MKVVLVGEDPVQELADAKRLRHVFQFDWSLLFNDLSNRLVTTKRVFLHRTH